MRLPKILLDLDGVLADFYQQLADYYNQRYNASITVEDFNDFEFERCFPIETVERLIEIFNEPGYFINLPVIPHAKEIASQFSTLGYQVKICTAPARKLDGFLNGQSAEEKFDWVAKHFPYWANSITVTQEKEDVQGDMLIDDSPVNISKWCARNKDGIGYLIDRPWNRPFKNYPLNCIRGDLLNVSKFVDSYWCSERDKFILRADELRQCQQKRFLA